MRVVLGRQLLLVALVLYSLPHTLSYLMSYTLLVRFGMFSYSSLLLILYTIHVLQ